MNDISTSDVATRYRLDELFDELTFEADKALPRASRRMAARIGMFLQGLSALHLGGYDDAGSVAGAGLTIEPLLSFLNSPPVRRYVTVSHRFLPPVLVWARLSGMLPEAYLATRERELVDPRASSEYRTFLELDARLTADPRIGAFLRVLDSDLLGGQSFQELESALMNPEILRRWLRDEQTAELIEGMQGLFDFAMELHDWLSSIEEFPIFQGNAWLHFAFWFDKCGARLRRVTSLVRTALAPEGLDLSNLEDAMADSTEPMRFARGTLALARAGIEAWDAVGNAALAPDVSDWAKRA